MKLDFILIVYGTEHIRLFQNFFLPNLKELWAEIPEAMRQQAVLRVFTSVDDEPEVRQSLKNAGFQNVDIQPRVQPDNPSFYGEMDRMHRLAIRDAWTRRAGMVFLFPDVLLSKGSFRFLFEQIQKGQRGVLFPAISVIKEDVEPLLNEMAKRQGTAFQIEAKKGVQIAMQYLHPMNRDLIFDQWRGRGRKSYPCAVYRLIQDQGFLIKTFLGYPLFIWPEREVLDYRGTFEMEFFKKALPNFSKITIVQRSEEIFGLELSPRDKTQYQRDIPNRWAKLLDVVLNHQRHTDYHLRCALNTYCAEAGEKITQKEITRFDRTINPVILGGLIYRWCRGVCKKYFPLVRFWAYFPFLIILSFLERIARFSEKLRR